MKLIRLDILRERIIKLDWIASFKKLTEKQSGDLKKYMVEFGHSYSTAMKTGNYIDLN